MLTESFIQANIIIKKVELIWNFFKIKTLDTVLCGKTLFKKKKKIQKLTLYYKKNQKRQKNKLKNETFIFF